MIHMTSIDTTTFPSDKNNGDEMWEYEYDAHETEEYYLTLDLTTHVPDARVTSTTGSRQPEINGLGSSNTTASTIQIIDLHTTSPMVKLDDSIYGCEWRTDLGTSFHIAKAGALDQPRRPGNVLDVVGLSRARLVGKPITLFRRSETEFVPALGSSYGRAIDIGNESDSESDQEPGESSEEPISINGIPPVLGHVLAIPRDLCKSRVAEDQAEFLERLSEIKVKRGENDPIPIYNVKAYNTPSATKQAEIRQQALSADVEKGRAVQDSATVITRDSDRKRRYRTTGAESGIENDPPQEPSLTALKRGKVRHEDVREAVGYQTQTHEAGVQPLPEDRRTGDFEAELTPTAEPAANSDTERLRG